MYLQVVIDSTFVGVHKFKVSEGVVFTLLLVEPRCLFKVLGRMFLTRVMFLGREYDP